MGILAFLYCEEFVKNVIDSFVCCFLLRSERKEKNIDLYLSYLVDLPIVKTPNAKSV